MESHVNRDDHAPTLGELRRDLLAVLIGNPLFTKEEQLLANHQAHECEDPQRLTKWLRDAHQEAIQREQTATESARAAKKDFLCGTDAPMEELLRLLNSSVLTHDERSYAQERISRQDVTPDPLVVVGRLYVDVLRRKGILKDGAGI